MSKSKITSSSTAEYFAKNLQQVGFSSPTKAVLTTLKEAVDNSLDACEEEGIAPSLEISIKKIGSGGSKNSDLVEVMVEDNGPGLDPDDVARVFGEYLASSKFGRGRCSRGQQGIGISAATTWAQLTNASGVSVMTKTSGMRKAFFGQVDVDIKSNKGLVKNKQTIDWDKKSGTRVTFKIDGRIQLNGDGGLVTYLEGTTLVNPHLEIKYSLLDHPTVVIKRVSDDVPKVPDATLPHPHTMKLGEFITHAGIYGKITFRNFLKTGFSRVTDQTISDFVKNGLPKALLDKPMTGLKEDSFKTVFQAIHKTELPSPSTKSVLVVGEEALSKSILRIGEIDFFSVVERKPKICDFKPVVVEVAIARFKNRGSEDQQVQLLRFANRVPLQFDKGACAITKAVESVNWRSYGLNQSRNAVPMGPYVFAISIVSPFIKFKNASKETIDASDDLVEEIRLALMQAGQKLSRHINRENKAADLERKIQHIEKFGPILVDTLVRITKASESRRQKAKLGLEKILGRDSKDAQKDFDEADVKLQKLKEKMKERGIGEFSGRDEDEITDEDVDENILKLTDETEKVQSTKKITLKAKKSDDGDDQEVDHKGTTKKTTKVEATKKKS